MIYSSTIGDIDLTKVVRLYPAAVVEVDGDVVQMSLEWADMNAQRVMITAFVLVFDFTLPNEKVRDKKEIYFKTKDELFKAMQEVAQFFQN
ncbi:MAG: hypothetical protein PHO62_09850 [Sulfurimonas sp.]|uniref:hypothetical protein n=1 Tax=Sulfurimonas sp. TaxID=2022749 RepID=UPI002612DCB9|nr:hypothetical protein [Sulfurimonas sp.]MDD5373712.1 hypothetical protein [Sulfurimonas sp.]